MKTRIIVDSTSDLMPNIKEQVHVVPLTVHFGQEEYVDGVTISHKAFYEKLVETDVHPSTSQATPAAFETEYEKAREAGEAAVVIALTSKLSGTYQSAMIAAAEYENIYVVDSGSVAIGGGILVEYALKLLNEGLEAKEIAEKLEEVKNRIVIVALVDTLEYLKKGGRISKTVAFAGTLLNIKPVISVPNGEIAVLGKARGTKRSFTMMAEETEKTGGIDFDMPVLAGYTGLSGEAMEQYLHGNAEQWADHSGKVDKTSICVVVGTHAGPGAVGVAFFHKN